MGSEQTAEVVPSWKTSVLWKSLEQKEDSDTASVRHVLEGWVPKIERVLVSGGTAPTDFTLHDAGHAFRVAQRMAEVVPEGVLAKLSCYEVALLLLSAYLHDIGMTPEQRKVSLHYQYLLIGDAGGLSEAEIARFQQWLDDDEQGVTPPMVSGAPSAEDLQKANELTAHYCRARHNDWSREWIEKNAPTVNLGSYAGWRENLILLCCSHHQDKAELEGSSFNPHLVGQPGQVVHLRYLACVLRIADILEFDPGRTPDVILRHRDISPKSLIYWHKDHEVSLVKEKQRLVVSARPTKAVIHRAIEEMLDEIDYELQLCKALSDETHFENCPGLVEKLPHRWDLLPSLHRDVKARDDTYEYIDGAFRPNTRKLLELFSGIELYGEPLAAVRELIQNAFDAVREQIAYERLRQETPSDPTLEITLGKLYRVDLRLEKRRDGFWLVCCDTGVGMNKKIITQHLLVSGRPRRHEIFELERRCKATGFTLGRTAQFGIGVLSYFMIADRVAIWTRRSAAPKDGDPTGWWFETEGVGSFGELRREPELDTGSRIELHLKKGLFSDPAEWFSRLREYLAEILILLPCEFQLNSALPGCESLVCKPRWTRGTDELTSEFLRGMKEERYGDRKSTPAGLLPERVRRAEEEVDRDWQRCKEVAGSCLCWITKVGELPEGLGRFRLHLGYFLLPGGVSLSFMNVLPEGKELRVGAIGKGQMYRPESGTVVSWKGMRTRVVEEHGIEGRYSLPFYGLGPNLLAEVDFQSEKAGKVRINRNTMFASSQALAALRWLRKEALQMLRSFVEEHHESAYAVLNSGMAKMSGSRIAEPQWIARAVGEKGEKLVWCRMSFPVVTSLAWKYGSFPREVRYKQRRVQVVPCVGERDDDDHYDGVSWPAVNIGPHKVVVRQGGRWTRVVPLWVKNPFTADLDDGERVLTSVFPAGWDEVLGVQFSSYLKGPFGGGGVQATVWNKGNKLVRMLKTEDWAWGEKQVLGVTDPLAIKSEILGARGRAIAWALCFVESGKWQVWEALLERDPSFLVNLWRVIFDIKGTAKVYKPLVLWVEEWGIDSRLREVTPEDWGACRLRDGGEVLERIQRYMPEPSLEWVLEEVGEEENRRAAAAKKMVAKGGKPKVDKPKKGTKRRKKS